MRYEQLTLQQVAEIVGGRIEGDAEARFASFASLDEAGPEDLTFADRRRASALAHSQAGAAIVSQDVPCDGWAGSLVRVDDVQQAVYRLLCKLAEGRRRPEPGVHPTAAVAAGARLGKDVAIGAGAVVGNATTIGDRTVLRAGAIVAENCRVGADCELGEGAVVRAESVLGDRVRIGPNSVIGYDGFGFQTIDGVHHRVPHLGNVVIEDDVEIDACTCVDRAKFGSTRIGRGAKIDNEVQIAHNCKIGAGSVLAGGTGIAGSATLGRYCVVAGQVGIKDGVTLGDGVQIGAKSVVLHDVAAGGQQLGIPARPAEETMRVWPAMKKLPDLLKRVRKLESRLEALESDKAKDD